MVVQSTVAEHELEHLVHRGQQTEVWFARSVDPMRRPVAVKRVRDLGDVDAIRRAEANLRAEGQVLERVQHRHLVPLLGRTEDPVTIVTPWLDGGTFRRLLDERGALTPAELVAVLHGIVAALDCLAEHGLVHGDLKPANILLDADGTPVLADLGSARPVGELADRGDRSGIVADGSGLGSGGALRASPAYLDPVMASCGTAAFTGDVWSLGVLAYEALTGRLPHRGEPAEILALAAAGAHRRLTDWPAVPREVAEVVEAALAPDPTDRPAHAGSLFDQLVTAVGSERIGPPPVPTTGGERDLDIPDHGTIEVGPRLAPPATSNGRGVGRKILQTVAVVGVAGLVTVLIGRPGDDDGELLEEEPAEVSASGASSWARGRSDDVTVGLVEEPGDEIVHGDWNGDGVKTPALYRPAEGLVYHLDRLPSPSEPEVRVLHVDQTVRHGRVVVEANPDGRGQSLRVVSDSLDGDG